MFWVLYSINWKRKRKEMLTQVLFGRRWRIGLRSWPLIMQLIFRPIKLFINFYFTDSDRSTFQQPKLQLFPLRTWYLNWLYLGRSPALSVARNKWASVHSHVCLWLLPVSFWQSRTCIGTEDHVGEAPCCAIYQCGNNHLTRCSFWLFL